MSKGHIDSTNPRRSNLVFTCSSGQSRKLRRQIGYILPKTALDKLHLDENILQNEAAVDQSTNMADDMRSNNGQLVVCLLP